MAGKVLTIEFEIGKQRFVAINAGPEFKLSEAVSFAVACKDQAEIDYFWEKLSSVPESEQCGWCKDKYGLSWQLVPENMGELQERALLVCGRIRSFAPDHRPKEILKKHGRHGARHVFTKP